MPVIRTLPEHDTHLLTYFDPDFLKCSYTLLALRERNALLKYYSLQRKQRFEKRAPCVTQLQTVKKTDFYKICEKLKQNQYGWPRSHSSVSFNTS